MTTMATTQDSSKALAMDCSPAPSADHGSASSVSQGCSADLEAEQPSAISDDSIADAGPWSCSPVSVADPSQSQGADSSRVASASPEFFCALPTPLRHAHREWSGEVQLGGKRLEFESPAERGLHLDGSCSSLDMEQTGSESNGSESHAVIDSTTTRLGSKDLGSAESHQEARRSWMRCTRSSKSFHLCWRACIFGFSLTVCVARVIVQGVRVIVQGIRVIYQVVPVIIRVARVIAHCQAARLLARAVRVITPSPFTLAITELSEMVAQFFWTGALIVWMITSVVQSLRAATSYIVSHCKGIARSRS